MTTTSRPKDSVGLRLVRRSNQVVTDVTLDHLSPADHPAGLSARATGDIGRRHRLATPAMTPNRERESLALAIMVDELSRNPGNLLQRLVEVVTGVCGVGTAAVAMTDGNGLGWDAVAGPMADAPRWTAFHRAGAARPVAARQPRSGAVTDRPGSLPDRGPGHRRCAGHLAATRRRDGRRAVDRQSRRWPHDHRRRRTRRGRAGQVGGVGMDHVGARRGRTLRQRSARASSWRW